MRWKINRTWRVVLIVLVVLVAFRLALPYIVTRYVNKVLHELDGYYGVVDDIDIHLYRGAYQIQGLKIYKTDGTKEIPFIDIPLIDLSVEWNALFQGAIVGEVKFQRPNLNFIAAKKSDNPSSPGEKPAEQSGKEVDWTEPIKKLMPLQINRLRINDGNVVFHDFSTKPKVDLFLHDLQLDAQNLNNAKDNPEKLPSRLYLQASSVGNGQLNLTMRINAMKEVPDLDMDMKFENVDMKALNDFFEAYAKVDIERGKFNLYSELMVLDGNINGYVKPIFNNLKVVDWKEDKKKPAKLVWESMVGFLTDIFKNQRKDQFATKVPMEGKISQVDTPFWPALWNIFSNAFVHAFENNTDGTISISSSQPLVAEKKPFTSKSKKELRKERRKEKREQKRKQRKAKHENEKADKKTSNKDNS